MINFEKFAAEGNEFINQLSRNLGHEEEKGRVGILLRSVLHELRNCLTMAQSLNFISQLPMFLKAIYVEQWKFSKKPHRIKTLNDFAKRVEEEQWRLGEREFEWNQPTIDLVKTVLNTLHVYVSHGQIEDMLAELPEELKVLFPEGVKVKQPS
jgi:uncharacterized protein (DUF2267 family)